MARGVEVRGLSTLFAQLDNLDPRTQAGLSNGVQRAGLLVEGAAKSNAPVDTGALRDSINASGSSSFITAAAESTVGTNIEYAPHVEFGTTRMAAQPYLRPALRNNRRKIAQLIADEIRSAYRSL